MRVSQIVMGCIEVMMAFPGSPTMISLRQSRVMFLLRNSSARGKSYLTMNEKRDVEKGPHIV